MTKNRFSFVMLLACLAFLTTAMTSENKGIVDKKGADQTIGESSAQIIGYDYPVKPGTAEWRAIGNHVQMVKATQIPEEILKDLTTEEVIESLLNHPLLFDVFLFGTLQKGFDVFLGRINVLQELMLREDRHTLLLSKYQSMQPLTHLSYEDAASQARQLTSLSFMEILLAQSDIRNEFTESQLAELEAEVARKQAIRLALPELYGSQPSDYEKVLDLNS